MLVIRLPLLAGLLGLAPAMALAQDAPPRAAAAPVATAASDVDTSALAYYASKHDTARMEAELRRLRSLYPNWTPPADPAALVPAAVQGVSEDQPLWDLFGVDKLDELDAEIARRKAANAAFEPPAELVSKLALKRARTALIAASDRKDDAAVVAIAARNPGLTAGDDLETSWRLADAYGRTGDRDKALKINETILDTNNDPTVRMATVRKAMVSLPSADLDQLMTKGRPAPDGRSEFDAITLDRVRQRVGRVLAGPATETAAPQDLARLEASASSTSGAVDAALLGWWYSKRQDWPQANTWFQIAMKASPLPAQAKPEDAKVAQGAVLALRASGKQSDAEELAYRWRDADPALALAYLDAVEADLTKPKPVALASDRLKQFGDVVVTQQSGDGAQALGWYAYNIGQYQPAHAWFEKAMAWQPRDSTALGFALSLKQIGDKPALATFLKDNGPTFPALAALSTEKPTKPDRPLAPEPRRSRSLPRRTDAGNPGPDRTVSSSRAPKSDQACAAGGAVGRTARVQTGWCLMSLNRPQEASAAFAAARNAGDSREDAAYGQALADLRSNRTDAAIIAARSTNLSPKRRSEIGLAALSQSAATAFDEGRYRETLDALNKRRLFTPEPRELSILRAWSNYHTDHVEEAQTLFSNLDAQLSTKDSRAGVAATNQSARSAGR